MLHALDDDLLQLVRQASLQVASTLQPRPKLGRRPEQSDAAPAAPQLAEDIRAHSYTTINACTGIQGGPQTPGTGTAKLYVEPTGPVGAAWQINNNPVQCENWMHGDPIPAHKPILLRKGRIADGNIQIYIVVAEGCKAVPAE